MTVSKVRNIRVDDPLWRLAAVVTKRRRETISGVVKRLLAEYVEQHATDEDRAAAEVDR
jgi:negative regulator of replication initiation